MKVTVGVGVLSKDKVTPYAADTMQAISFNNWCYPIGNSSNWAAFAQAVNDPRTKSIEVITKSNQMFTFTK
jgi:hypothetical protein